MPKSTGPRRRVLLNRKNLMVHLKRFSRYRDVEFPELSGKMGFPEDVVPVLKIRAASLDNHIRARTVAERAAIMGMKIVKDTTEGMKKDVGEFLNIDWITEELKKPQNEKTMLEVSLFHRCVVKPKFTMRDAYVISESMPEVVNRVATTALQMSSLEMIDDNPKRSKSNNICC